MELCKFSICLKAKMCYQSLRRFSPLRGLKVSVACEMMLQSNCWKTGGLEEVEDCMLICLAWVCGYLYVYVSIYVCMYVFLCVREACSP